MIFRNSSLTNSKNILSVSILIVLIPNINQQRMLKEKDTFKSISRTLLEPLHASLETSSLQNPNNQHIQENI